MHYGAFDVPGSQPTAAQHDPPEAPQLLPQVRRLVALWRKGDTGSGWSPKRRDRRCPWRTSEDGPAPAPSLRFGESCAAHKRCDSRENEKHTILGSVVVGTWQAGGVPGADRCLVLGAGLGRCRHPRGLALKVARLGQPAG